MELNQKIVSLEEAILISNEWKKEGLKVVFTNGCFDILHKGHVNYLHQTAQTGDRLILGLNSDGSVKRLGKGEDRPINKEQDRAYVLSGLESISLIVVFNEDTPFELIKNLNPNIITKGGDYSPDVIDKKDKQYIVGSDIVKKNGGKVIAINFVDGYSTTQTINKMKKEA